MITNMKKEQGNSKPLIYIGVGTTLLFIVLIYLGSQQNKKASVPLAGEELSEEWLTRVARYVARHTKFFELNMWDDMDEM